MLKIHIPEFDTNDSKIPLKCTKEGSCEKPTIHWEFDPQFWKDNLIPSNDLEQKATRDIEIQDTSLTMDKCIECETYLTKIQKKICEDLTSANKMQELYYCNEHLPNKHKTDNITLKSREPQSVIKSMAMIYYNDTKKKILWTMINIPPSIKGIVNNHMTPGATGNNRMTGINVRSSKIRVLNNKIEAQQLYPLSIAPSGRVIRSRSHYIPPSSSPQFGGEDKYVIQMYALNKQLIVDTMDMTYDKFIELVCESNDCIISSTPTVFAI
jgi:hypothetical protein